MTEPQAGLTARHMTEMLRRHYQPEGRPPAGLFAPEIQSPNGNRRADVIWMPTTVAGGTGLHGHEIKISRADLLAELDDPTKSDPWAKYCTRWWLVVSHPSLVAGLTIPDAWGILAPPSGRRTRTMTVVRDAPELKPVNPAPGFAKLAAWQLYNTSEAVASLTRDRNRLETTVKTMDRQIDELRVSGGRAPDQRTRMVASILARVDQLCRDEHIWTHDREDVIVATIVDHLASREAAETMRRDVANLVSTVERIMEPFKFVGRELRKAERLASARQAMEPGIADAVETVLPSFPEAEVA